MPLRCYPCPRTPVTHVPRTNTVDKERGQKGFSGLYFSFFSNFREAEFMQ